MAARKAPSFESFLAVRFKRRDGLHVVDAARVDPTDSDPVATAAANLVASHWRAGVPPRGKTYPHDKLKVRRPSMEWCQLKVRGYIGSALDAIAKAESGACKWSKTPPVKVNPAYARRIVEDWDRGHGSNDPWPSARLAGQRRRR